VNCPECNAAMPWSAEDLEDGEIIECPECWGMLEVIFLDGGGIALDLAAEPEDSFEYGED